ncbi:aspartate dehydrogenase [Roseovarius nubinhibens]|uniref:aspartate dehydrogenase n=1 Tax=Roseovarius nubinhibens TaxID=314263 RepID=UPI001C083F2D|nr:aspartate dehydrogenase [Roseovarius nubinhibens]MBU2999780.1 aspartate dehydrogenase [Roseovarius nubinhibens]
MKIGLIGGGAIGCYVAAELAARGLGPEAVLTRSGPEHARGSDGVLRLRRLEDLPEGITLMVDCAGHAALAEHGAAILERGIDLITVSLGALADPALAERLAEAAERGGAQLHLASGAIGALDALAAARVGGLASVTYVGRKPPRGWQGSPAEERLDLARLDQAATHFEGSAREAAQRYPKNANVAAAVAFAGIGFDATQVRLVADPGVTENIHEIHAEGAFGTLSFRINGKPLPDNPRSSALAAMSAVAAIERRCAPITI